MAHSRPLAVDLFTGLHGWAEGLVAEGFEVVGFDLEDMCGQFGHPRPDHVSLVIQDVLTLHGSQFRNADLIVASPPCQKYSYMAMPWRRSKALAEWYREHFDCSACDGTGNFYRRDEDDDFLECDHCAATGHSGERILELNALFNACFRIKREASEAAGRDIPLVVENVRGAIPWVGRSRWNFGSYHLWGDVPALMPPSLRTQKNGHVGGGSWFAIGGPGQKKVLGNPDGRKAPTGTAWFNDAPRTKDSLASMGGKSPARKAASAMIAKIPLPLARHIGATFRPVHLAVAA